MFAVQVPHLAAQLQDDPKLNQELLQEAADGSVSKVRRLLRKGANVNCADTKFGGTPLHWAAYNGHRRVVKLLVSKGAEINARNNDGRTPFMLAAAMGHHRVVQLLAEEGATVDAQDNSGRTAMDWAREKNRSRVVRELEGIADKRAEQARKQRKKEVADIVADARERMLTLQLFRAAENGDVKAIRGLLRKGAEVDARDEQGMTPLMYAGLAGRLEAVEFLVRKGANVNITDASGKTASAYAAAGNHDKIVQFLAKHGAARADAAEDTKTEIVTAADPNVELLAAASRGDLESVKKLVDRGADVNARDPMKNTPLMLAAMGGHTDTAAFLLEKGADPALKQVGGMTAAHWAEAAGNDDIARMLGKAPKTAAAEPKPSAEKKSEPKPTPVPDRKKAVEPSPVPSKAEKPKGLVKELFQAVEGGDAKKVKTLIDKGADVNSRDEKKQTPLMKAAVQGRAALVEALLKAGADVNARDFLDRNALLLALVRGHEKAARQLIEAGADPNSAGLSGKTALMTAASAGLTDIVKLLLDKGAEVNAQDKLGLTALSWAVPAGHTDVVKLLLDKGANVNAADVDGNTPLMWAAGVRQVTAETDTGVWTAAGGAWNPQIIGILLKAGADLEAKNKAGKTAREIAKASGNQDLRKAFAEAKTEKKPGSAEKKTAKRKAAEKQSKEEPKKELTGKKSEPGKRTAPPPPTPAAEQKPSKPESAPERKPVPSATPSGSVSKDLDHALSFGDVAKVKEIVNKGIDVNATGERGYPLLMLATGSFISYQENGYSLSHGMAKDAERAKIAEFLINKGAKVNKPDPDGVTALILAAGTGRLQLLKTLLDNGAEVNHADSRGNTALMWAAKWGKSPEVVETLIKAGADVNHKNKNDETPQFWARGMLAFDDEAKAKKKKIIELLEQHAGKTAGDPTDRMKSADDNSIDGTANDGRNKRRSSNEPSEPITAEAQTVPPIPIKSPVSADNPPIPEDAQSSGETVKKPTPVAPSPSTASKAEQPKKNSRISPIGPQTATRRVI